MDKNIIQLADHLHEIWRETRKLGDGSYEPHFEPTTDKKWIKINKTETVDLANTEFAKLPTDWQKENNFAAQSAMNSLSFDSKGGPDIEKTSSLIHQDWLKRHPGAPAHLKVDYDDLPEEKKAKDNKIARLAFGMC